MIDGIVVFFPLHILLYFTFPQHLKDYFKLCNWLKERNLKVKNIEKQYLKCKVIRPGIEFFTNGNLFCIGNAICTYIYAHVWERNLHFYFKQNLIFAKILKSLLLFSKKFICRILYADIQWQFIIYIKGLHNKSPFNS